MAYLSKDDYERRQNSAARRHANNEEVLTSQGVPEEVAKLISELCSARHELHSNKDHYISGPDQSVMTQLVRINSDLREAGFPHMSFIPSYTDDYIDIDDLYTLSDIEGMSSDDEDWDEWRSDNYSRISDELEELNSEIEGYLAQIDKQYGTNFAPTGAQRIY